MEKDLVQEKINFLEKVLKFARENPEFVTSEGRAIFYEDYPAYEESCVIGLHLDKKGIPYFKVKGDYNEKNGEIFTGEELLSSASKYLKKDLVGFKHSFHLYKTKEGGQDLLDELR